MAAAQAASVLQSFPFRATVLALLPLLPSQAPEGLVAGAGAGQAFLAKAWELLHLLLVGIAVSYGLFSRRNNADDGRGGGGVVAAEKDAKPVAPDSRYVSLMFRDSLGPFDDDDDEGMVPDSPPGGEDEGGGANVRSWSALHRPDEPVVVVANGGGGRVLERPAPA
uniref:Uncharacterized protein n=1 Tax=Arundo donax TaxID=35708 RepID=A0A0A8ZJI5_ARUDO